METVATADVANWLRQRATGFDRFLFGIAGPPGCGKSTVAAALGRELSAPIVAMDGFHLPNATLIGRGLRDIKGAPETFASDEFVDLVRRLRERSAPIGAPIFDRRLDEPIADRVVVRPGDDVVIIEGNYLLLDESPWADLVSLIDAVGYVDVPDDVRIERLIARHVAFGKSVDDAAEFVLRSDERNTARVAAFRSRASLLLIPDVVPH